jgi:hypothetical protein
MLLLHALGANERAMSIAALLLGKAKPERESMESDMEATPDGGEKAEAVKDFYGYCRRGMWEQAADALHAAVMACVDEEKE